MVVAPLLVRLMEGSSTSSWKRTREQERLRFVPVGAASPGVAEAGRLDLDRPRESSRLPREPSLGARSLALPLSWGADAAVLGSWEEYGAGEGLRRALLRPRLIARCCTYSPAVIVVTVDRLSFE